MDSFPDVLGYVVGAGGGRARGLGEGGRDFLLAHRKVVRVGGEVNVCQDGGWGSGEEVVEEGSVDAVGGVFVRKGRKAGLLSTARQLFCFRYGEGEREERYSAQWENFACLMALK